jgi:hypothetical protein
LNVQTPEPWHWFQVFRHPSENLQLRVNKTGYDVAVKLAFALRLGTMKVKKLGFVESGTDKA